MKEKIKGFIVILSLSLIIVSCTKGQSMQSVTAPTIGNMSSGTPAEETGEVISMKLVSNDFQDNRDIPREFTCQGKDMSPHLAWSGAPEGTKSFALSVDDPDAPIGDWIHWLVYNIPADVKEFPKGTYKGTQVVNDFGKKDYGGPCPPSGKHRYIFTLYAFDTPEIKGLVTKENFRNVMGGHTIAKVQLVGLYKKI